MTPTEREQQAREWLHKWESMDGARFFVGGDRESFFEAFIALLAAQRAKMLEEADEEGVTAAMREADRFFEKVGGSTRHYVRDCLIPIMKKRGLIVVREQIKGGA